VTKRIYITGVTVSLVRLIARCAFFGKLTHAVKTRLFQTYCNSRYGCELWSLDDSSINAFGVTWRKAVIRILNTLPDTHNNLVPLLLGNTLPFFDDLCKRAARFILECIQSESSLVRSVARFGIVAGLGNSFIVRNVVFLCSHFGWQLNEFVEGKISLQTARFLSHFCIFIMKS